MKRSNDFPMHKQRHKKIHTHIDRNHSVPAVGKVVRAKSKYCDIKKCIISFIDWHNLRFYGKLQNASEQAAATRQKKEIILSQATNAKKYSEPNWIRSETGEIGFNAIIELYNAPNNAFFSHTVIRKGSANKQKQKHATTKKKDAESKRIQV